MKLETPIIVLVLVSFIFIGMFTFFLNIANEYNSRGENINIDDLSQIKVNNRTVDFTSVFNKINDSKKATEDMETTFRQITPNPLSIFPFIQLVWNLGNQMLNSLDIFKDLLAVTSQILGVNLSFLFIILLITVIIALAMLLAGRTYAG